jgi:hypothetical protein
MESNKDALLRSVVRFLAGFLIPSEIEIPENFSGLVLIFHGV